MKNKLFSRLSALALTLAMLLPCVMTAPADAAGFAVELFRWDVVHPAETNMEEIKDNLRRGTERTQTHTLSSTTYTAADGTAVKTMGYRLYNGANANYGLPYEAQGSAKAKTTEGLQLSFNKFTPTTTRGLEAVNVHLTYFHQSTGYEPPVFAVDEFDVKVSKDGSTWLEDSVGIRSWKLRGHGINVYNQNVYIYDIETENLFDIEGFNSGDKLANIMIRPFGEHYFTYGYFTMEDVTVNGYETMQDWETAVPARRTYTQVGEEKMRDIVVQHGYRIAETEWSTDAIFYSSWPALNGQAAAGKDFPKDLTMRGPVYTRIQKTGYDLWMETMVNGKYTGSNSAGSGWGMDCMSFAYDCYSRVSRSYSWVLWQTQSDPKLKLLGNLNANVSATWTNTDIFPLNSKQSILESYTALEPGDLIISNTSTGGIHIMIAAATPKVVRNTDGTIDPNKSSIVINEQGATLNYFFRTPSGSIVSYPALGDADAVADLLAKSPGYEFLYLSCTRPDNEHTFATLYNDYYAPYTLAEYETGMVEDLDFQSVLVPKENDITKGFTAAVSANYHICKLTVELLDTATGEVLYSDSQTGNPNAGNQSTLTHQLYYNWYYDTPELDAALGNLSNGSYRIAVSMLGGPVIEIGADRPTTTHYYDFTISDKAPTTTVSVKSPSSAAKGETITVPVNVSGNYAAADVEIKFDSDKLTYVSGTITPNGLFKEVQTTKGITRIMLVDAAASAGQLAQLTFTAKEDISGLGNLFTVKSAQLSTQDSANSDIAIKGTDASKPCASANFADVAPSAWYHDAVDYALNNSIMGGYNATTFGPNDTLTRAMVVQVLYNKEGQPAINGSHKFPDVKSGDWFNNAVTWANVNKVVGGYGDGRFGPNDKVTLEQIAVILWNYSGNPTPTGDASSLGTHSDWAANALSWAAAKGIFKNVPYNTVTGTATRAQTAQMLMNYLTK